MKKNFTVIALAAAMIAAATSCQKDELVNQNDGQQDQSLVFYATLEDVTKTTITNEGTAGYKISWEATDSVSVNGILYKAVPDGINPAKAKFVKMREEDPNPSAPFKVYYPASIYDSATKVATLPDTQVYKADGNIAGILPMYAESSDINLKFKNLCGLFKFILKGTEKVQHITITDGAKALSGKFTISGDAAVIDGTATGGVTLDCGEGVQLDAATGKSFYIAVPAGSYEKLHVEYNTVNYEKYAKMAANTTATVARNKVYGWDQSPTFKPDLFKGYSFPICETLEIDNPNTHNLVNVTINGKVCKFDGGMKIKLLKFNKTDTISTIEFVCPSHVQPSSGGDADKSIHRSIRFTGFAQYDTIQIALPVRAKLSGDLRMMLGARAASFTSVGWDYYWSNDEVSWNKLTDIVAKTPGSDALWNTIDFTIPGIKSIPERGTFYFRFVATGKRAKNYVDFANSICVCNATAPVSLLPEMDNTVIAFSQGFDDLVNSRTAYAELPIGFMRSATSGYASNYSTFNNQYKPSEGYDTLLVTTGCFCRPGYLQMGYYDESLWSRQCIGNYKINIGKRLKDMDISSATVKLSFSAARFKDFRGYDPIANVFVKCNNDSIPITVTVDKFAKYEATFEQVTQSSEITISSHRLSNDEISALGRGSNAKYLIDNRFYIDDVLVKVLNKESKK